MATLVWDKPGDRVYESGLDKGVLYLPDGSAVPWNGLTSVIEKFDKSTSPVYFDGMKIQDFVVLGDFAATLKAITYPDEFIPLEGLDNFRHGAFLADQPPQVFGLCYRTRVGNDLTGEEVGHKLNLLYNVTAIPSDKTYAPASDQPSLVEFEWTITAIPEETPGFRPTAHIVFDDKDLDPWLLEDLEAKLYGTSSAEAVLLPMPDLIAFVRDWYRVKIIDNGDGSWTAISVRDGFIFFTDDAETEFEITKINALYLDDVTFQISDTTDISQVPQISISYDAYDGSWSATTDQDNLIFVESDGTFTIYNAEAVMIDADSYRLSDTVETS